MTEGPFHGLIQHSFALRVPPELRPLYAREGVADTEGLLRGIFETGDFELGVAGMEEASVQGGSGAWKHSILVSPTKDESTGLTNVVPRLLPFKEHGKIPSALRWGRDGEEEVEPWQAFALGSQERSGRSVRNDFLLEDPGAGDETDALEASRFLCQLLAHRRSLLFGLQLGRSTFNVLPPHGLLAPGSGRESGSWLVQPAISLFKDYAKRRFRPIACFSFFLIPIDANGSSLAARRMGKDEIHEVVKSQWPLATAFESPDDRPKFEFTGPLKAYLESIAEPSLRALGLDQGGLATELTLRTFTETTLFSLASGMAAGPGATLGERSRRKLGDRVVTALSASRVTSVAVLDDCGPGTDEVPLEETLAELGQVIASPLKSEKEEVNKYRLDRFLFDRLGYVSAVLPDDRCVVTVGSEDVQNGLETSLLLETGWIAYRVVGAATATGLIRSIFREITLSGPARPERIADIEREAMIDLHETYDIEITVEAYRKHYSLLRKHLGIDDEYAALGTKLEALHRETRTRSEARSERSLALLTWAIVILSALILAGTLALILKHGG